MKFQLRNPQLFLNGCELANQRLEYYKTYGLLFEYSPEKLMDLLNIEENAEDLYKEYLDLFIRPSNKYVSPYGSAYTKTKRRKRNILLHFLVTNSDNQKPDDHIIIGLNYMRFLVEREKQQWQRKNYLMATNLLHREQDYLLHHLHWLPKLCAEIQKKTTSQFYHDVALNLTNFFNSEKLLLEILLVNRLNTVSTLN